MATEPIERVRFHNKGHLKNNDVNRNFSRKWMHVLFLCAPDAAVWTWQPLTCHGLRHVMDQNHSKPPPKPAMGCPWCHSKILKGQKWRCKVPDCQWFFTHQLWLSEDLEKKDASYTYSYLKYLEVMDFPWRFTMGNFRDSLWFSPQSPLHMVHDSLTHFFRARHDLLVGGNGWVFLEGKAIVGCLSGFPFLDVGLGRRQGRLKVGPVGPVGSC